MHTYFQSSAPSPVVRWKAGPFGRGGGGQSDCCTLIGFSQYCYCMFPPTVTPPRWPELQNVWVYLLYHRNVEYRMFRSPAIRGGIESSNRAPKFNPRGFHIFTLTNRLEPSPWGRESKKRISPILDTNLHYNHCD